MITAIFGPITEVILAAGYLDGWYYYWYDNEYIHKQNYENTAQLAISSCAFTMRK